MSVYADASPQNEGINNESYISVGSSPKQSDVYNTNYVLIVLEVMQQLGLGPLEDIMQTEAKMMDVTAEIQSDLTTIQQYLTKIEKLAHSGGAWKMPVGNGWDGLPKGQKTWFGPNANNGIAYNEFHESTNQNNKNDYYCAEDLKSATDGFIAAMKDLFQCQPCQSDDPMAGSNFTSFSTTKSTGDGKTITQNFNLKDIFSHLNDNTKSGWGILGKFGQSPVFTTSSSNSASLIQQYTYYQYKLAAEQHDGPVPDGDLTKLGFSMDPTATNFDGVGKSLFGLASSFNTTVTTDRENDSECKYNEQINNQSGNFLSYIFSDDPYALKNLGTPYWAGGFQVNILGAFSFAAFNYFWTKNPNASTDQKDNTIPQPPTYIDPNGKKTNYSYDDSDKGVTADGDKLSVWYSNSQSSSSLISSNSNEASTTMQEYTSEVSQFQNIGQNIVKSGNENNIATIQNYKSG